ncbi:radical SAM protein [Streptomyces sp. NPDC057654]|uniref:radical SAM protein n=1 Tax=Streptomyces sp. NPDC057654 TaxID=3346196 RepID=UPI00369FA94D
MQTANLFNDHTFSKKDVLLLHGIDNYNRDDLDLLKEVRENGNPDAILSICVSTTSACNIRCWYCYALGNKKRNPSQLSVDEYRNLIDQAVDLGARTMIVCGDGEPTYDPALTDIVRHAVSRELMPVIVTNGTIMGNDRVSKHLHGLDGRELTQFLSDSGASLLVKLETLDPKLYESIVNVRGAWEKFEAGVDRMMAAGFGDTWEQPDGTYTRMSFTGIATKENVDSVPTMKQWARDHNAQFICKVPSPIGGALDQAATKLFPPAEVESVRTLIDNYTDKRETLTPIVLDGDKCMTCLAWHLGPVITEEGYYVECYTATEATFGNVREKSLSQLLKEKVKGTDWDNPCPIKDRLYVQLTQKMQEQQKAEEVICTG